jgi:hypothetical protein
MDKAELATLLGPVLEVVRSVDPAAPGAAAELRRRLPLDHAAIVSLRAAVREGVAAGWLCDRSHGELRYSRLQKVDATGWSIDAVHMSGTGGAHVHPNGEVDLCFAVSGSPRFDGEPEGWTVYGPNTWHEPTVEGGLMDILYFLPSGAIVFGAQPDGTVPVGLQATAGHGR